MHSLCMPTKTISLLTEAYEKLKRAKRTPSESFSDVVMRARWDDVTTTATDLLRRMDDRGPIYTVDEFDRLHEIEEQNMEDTS